MTDLLVRAFARVLLAAYVGIHATLDVVSVLVPAGLPWPYLLGLCIGASLVAYAIVLAVTGEQRIRR